MIKILFLLFIYVLNAKTQKWKVFEIKLMNFPNLQDFRLKVKKNTYVKIVMSDVRDG